MKVGDKVKLIRGNPFGNVGIIVKIMRMTRPTSVERGGLKEIKLEDNFLCRADDGTTFSGFEDQLELIE